MNQKEKLLEKNNLIFCVNKPLNWTSNDVVQYIKQKNNYKKVGHAGTLDPNATGVLVIGVNEGTKLLNKLVNDKKVYIAKIKLGIETDTYDITGKIVHTETFENISKLKILTEINFFKKNEYLQMPPIYSAIKVNGKKLYEYARKNESVDIKPRLVKINKIEVLNFFLNEGIIEIKLDVSKGFYVRSFAHDLGIALKTCGCLLELCRIQSGEFLISDSISINNS